MTIYSSSEDPGPFEHQWADRVEADRVWSPDGGDGLRFTPTDDQATVEQPAPAAWTVPDFESREPLPRRNRVSLFVATCLVMALMGAAVGAALGSRQHANTSRAAAQQPFTPPLFSPPTTTPSSPFTPPTTTPSSPSSPSPSSPSTGSDGSTGPAASPDASHGVVNINTTLAVGGEAAGTGMVLTPTGEVLTNNHVIAGSSSIKVEVPGGSTYDATVVGTDATDDVAVIQLSKASGLDTVKTATGSPNVGDAVTAVGNALGKGGTPTVVTGTVTDLDQTITVADDLTGADRQLTNLIQTNAPLQPGDSGGPLLNSSSQVIGVDTAASAGRRFRAGAQEGYAIPIAKALSIANQIEAGKSSATIQIGPPAYLGVLLSNGNSRQFGNGGSSSDPSTQPAAVAGVSSGAPADKAGLKQGDTITGVAGQRVNSVADLEAALAQHHPGDKVSLTWTDSSGQQHSATVTLASGPPK